MEIYLDNSATTAVSAPVMERMNAMMTANFGNPSSLHRKGFEAEQALSAARSEVAAVLGVPGERITFTCCGSEANNLAIVGACRARRRQGGRVITTAVEHESVLAPVRQLGSEGFEPVFIAPNPDGTVSPAAVADAVNEHTALVSVMHVNSETGAVNDIPAIVSAVRRKNPNLLFHCDCVQSFCKLPVTPLSWGADLVSVSAHKIHGPKGVGALYTAKGVRLLPLYYGSGQEKGLHPGTENVPGICGFGLAATQMWAKRRENTEIFRLLRRHLIENLSQIPGVCINSPEQGAPYIVNFSVPAVGSEVMIHHLERYGIYLSSGSAGARGARSHVLTAMGLPPVRIDGALRVSFCAENTTEQLDELTLRLREGLKTLAARR